MKKISEKRITIKDPISGYDKKIISKKFVLPNGMVENFFIDESKDSVQVFALTENQSKVIVIKQFRPGTEKEELELPGGVMEPGEDPLVAGARELKEETSYEAINFILLSKISYSPYSTGKRYNVLATNCRRSKNGMDLDPNEFLKAGTMPLEAFREVMRTGSVRGIEAAYQGLEKLSLL